MSTWNQEHADECACDDCEGDREFRAQHGFEQALEMVRSGSSRKSSDYYYAANWVADEYERLKGT